MINANPSPFNSSTPAPQVSVTPPTTPEALPTAMLDQPANPKKKMNWKYIVSGLLLLLLLVGGAVAFYLVRMNQDVRQQAAVEAPSTGSGGSSTSITITCCKNGSNTSITQSCAGITSGGGCTAAASNQCTSQGGTIGPCVLQNPNPLVCTPGASRCNSGLGEIVRCLDDGSGEVTTGLACSTADSGGNSSGNNGTSTPTSGSSSTNPVSIAAGATCAYNYCKCISGPETGELITKGEKCNEDHPIMCYNINTGCSSYQASYTSTNRSQTCSTYGSHLYQTVLACRAAQCSRQNLTWDASKQSCIGTHDAMCYSAADGCQAQSTPCTGDSTTYSTQLNCQRANNLEPGCGGLNQTPCTEIDGTSDVSCNHGYVLNAARTLCISTNYPEGQSCADTLGSSYTTAKQLCTNADHTWSDTTCTCSGNYATQDSHGPCCINGVYKAVCLKSESSTTYGGTKQQCEGTDTTANAGTENNTNTNVCTDPAKANQSVAQYVKFTCDNGCRQDSDGLYRCYENPEYSSGPLTLDGACGQVDLYTTAGEWGSYCGYSEYNCGGPCQGGGQVQTPANQDDDVPENPPVGPICLNVALVDTQGVAVSTPSLNQQVALSCGQVSGVNRYDFKLIYPDGTASYKEGTASTSPARISTPFSLTQSGKYIAQCRICTSVSGTTQCQDFESISN